MLLRPQGLAGGAYAPIAAETDDDAEVPETAAGPATRSDPGVAARRAPPGRRDGRAMLDVRGVTKAFGGVVALNEVDLVVPRGAIIGLIGPNGAGKTTFFNVVTGPRSPGRRPHHVRGHQSARDFAQRHRGARHRAHVPVDPALPA
jgi:ATPase subunit of ABC transporter with duplicated ATPase domains